MSRTVIKPIAVLNADQMAKTAANKVGSALNSVVRVKNGVDSRIKNRNNISSRFNKAQNKISDINNLIAKIRTTVNNSASHYSSTEDSIAQQSRNIGNGVCIRSQAVASPLVCMFDGGAGKNVIDNNTVVDSQTAISAETISTAKSRTNKLKTGMEHTITTGSVLWASRAGLASFDIKQSGNYIHIYGNRKAREILDLPKGNRAKIGSDTYYKNGYALWYDGATLGDRFKSSFSNFGKDTFLSKGSILSYAGIAAECVIDTVGNVKNGASTSKIAADISTDVVKGVGNMAVSAVGAKTGAAVGAAIGSVFPGVGTVVGGVVGSLVGGAVAGFAYDFAVEKVQIGGNSVAGWVSTGLETAYTAVGDALKSTGKAISDGFEIAKTNITNAVNDFTSSVGDAFKSAGDGLSNFFKKAFA